MKKENFVLKRLLGLVSLTVLVALVMVGCGKKEETHTYELEKNGVKITMVFTAKGDKVLKQTTDTVLNYAKNGLDKVSAEAAMSPISKTYQGIDGLKESCDFQEDQVTEHLEIDYTKVNFDEIKNIKGIYLSGNAKSGVSLKKTVGSIEAAGFKKVTKNSKDKKATSVSSSKTSSSTSSSAVAKEEKYIYRHTSEASTVTMTFFAKGDRVFKQSTESIIPYAPNMTKEQAEEVIAPVSQTFQGIDGLKESCEFQEGRFIERVEIDYTVADYNKVKDLEGMNFTGDFSQGVSLQKSIELVESSGFTKVSE